MRHEHGHFCRVVAQGARNLLACQHQPARGVQDEVNRAVRRCHAHHTQQVLGVFDIDVAEHRDAEQRQCLLPMDHRNHAGASLPFERRNRLQTRRLQHPLFDNGRQKGVNQKKPEYLVHYCREKAFHLVHLLCVYYSLHLKKKPAC
jgi:hypothetical protein